MFKNLFPGSAMLAGLALSFLALTAQAVPLFITTPEDGGELDEEFRIVFTQTMQETISVEFAGIGDAEIGCGWLVLIEGQPLQILDCEVTSGQLPAGSTVTWTINPGGTGMTTVGGTVIPESTGTFTTPGGSGTVVEISVDPTNGAIYDPSSDGPVTFTFNVAMDPSVAAGDAVSFDQGTWTIIWVGNTSIQCTASGNLEPGFYEYTVSGLTSQDGSEAPVLNGGFLVELDPGGGDIGFFPNPPDGGTLMQFPGVATEVTFVFSEPMDASVDLADAVTFSQGDWNCTWTEILPGFPVTGMGCKPTGVLPGGVYEYTLSGLKSASGESAPNFTGSFTVEGGGTGGEIIGGDPAPDCDPDAVTHSFPKSFYICGPDLFSWNGASSFPGFGGGFLVAGSADVIGGTQSSMLMLDDAGMQIGGVLATDIGVRLDAWPQQSKILATQGGTLVQPDVSIGLFDLSGGDVTADFQHKIAVAGDDVSTSFLPDGRVHLLRGANEEIEWIVFNANGSVAWSKRYSADAFGVDTSVPGANRQDVRLSVLETGGFLLFVSKTEIDIDTGGGGAATRNASTIVTRLDPAGAVQWSKVYTLADELDSLVASGPMQDGSIILSGSFTGGSSPSNPMTTAVFARLDANGNISWQKKVEGAFISPMGATADGKILLGGGQGSGFQFDLVIMVMDVNGNVESQVRIDALDIDVGFATVAGDRVFYNLISQDAPVIDPENPPANNGTAQTAIIGSSSLALNGFTWKQYARPVSAAHLGVDPETSNPFFSAFREDTNRMDAVPLSENLTAAGNCALFTDATVTVQGANFVFEDVVFNAAEVGVVAADFSPELLEAGIVLDPFVAAEVDVCDEGGGGGGGDCALPVTLTITALPQSGTATIGFTSVSGCTHTLQRAATPDATVWIPIETIPGNGVPYTRQIDLNAQSEYYRVVNEN